jgi:hypothetical protein
VPKIPPLTKSTIDGAPYRRRADIEARIAEVLQRPQNEWATIAAALPDEALVFIIRQADKNESNLIGALTRELSRRIVNVGRRWAKGFSTVTTEEILYTVETKVIELVFAERPSRQSEYLEMAFSRIVKGKTLNEVLKYRDRPASIKRAQHEDRKPEEPIYDGAGPLDQLFKAEDAGLVRRALAAVSDERHRKAVVLRHVNGWPLTSSDPAQPSLEKHFGMSGRQIQNWITSALEIMRAEIEGTI